MHPGGEFTAPFECIQLFQHLQQRFLGKFLVQGALVGMPPDTTFAWFVHNDGWKVWTGFLFYAGMVTTFAEELFFRGRLLGTLRGRLKPAWAILAQVAVFTLTQLIASLLLSPVRGVVYAFAYSWQGAGVVGGVAHGQHLDQPDGGHYLERHPDRLGCVSR